MDSLDPPAEEMVGNISITSPLPQAVLRCLSVCALSSKYISTVVTGLAKWEVGCSSVLVFPGECLVCDNRKMKGPS